MVINKAPINTVYLNSLLLDEHFQGEIAYEQLTVGRKLGSGGFKDCYAGTYMGVSMACFSVCCVSCLRSKHSFFFVLMHGFPRIGYYHKQNHAKKIGSGCHWRTTRAKLYRDGYHRDEAWDQCPQVSFLWVSFLVESIGLITTMNKQFWLISFFNQWTGNCDMKTLSDSLACAPTSSIYVL